MHIKRIFSIFFIVLAVPALYSCERDTANETTLSGTATAAKTSPPADANQGPSPFMPAASIQDIMVSIVDPSADYLWDSVSIVSTREGTIENRPRTDEEWDELRHRAVTLLEATNLLVMEGRRVVDEGKKVQDEDQEGILSSAQIQELIDQDHTSFEALARALHDTTLIALKAIDDRNVDAFFEAGGDIDTACEACHTEFWYPNQGIPYGP